MRLNLPLGVIPAVLLIERQTGSDVTARSSDDSSVGTRITLSRNSSDETLQSNAEHAKTFHRIPLEFSAFSLEFSFFSFPSFAVRQSLQQEPRKKNSHLCARHKISPARRSSARGNDRQITD